MTTGVRPFFTGSAQPAWRSKGRPHLVAKNTVIRTAPRRFALAFFPALLAFVLGVMVVASLMLTPRPGEEGLVIPAIACVALLCVGLHVFYLRLVARSLGGWGK